MSNRTTQQTELSLKMGLRTLSQRMGEQAYSISIDHLDALTQELAQDPNLMSVLLGVVKAQAELAAAASALPVNRATYSATAQAAELANATFSGLTWQTRQTIRQLTKETLG